MTAVERLAEIEARNALGKIQHGYAMARAWVESRADARTLAAALRAVLALHRPLNDLGSPPCSSCLGDEDGESTFVPWPCPTVRAITAALDVTA